jgi:hypothetical protein
MLARGSGVLVHIASIAAGQPQGMSGAYSTSKAAVATYRNISRFIIIDQKAFQKCRDLWERKWSLALTQTSLP